jgi:HPt (histidine-containing phosphotransfer) domain-containing protein
MTVEDQLRALIERHCLTIRNGVVEIGRALAGRAQPGEARRAGPADAVTRAEALAHQLKGGSGSIGFVEVSAAATALDDHLKALLAGDDAEIGSQAERTRDLFARLQRAAAAMRPESSTLFRADLSGFGGTG